MNTYELTVVYSPNLSEVKQKKALTAFEALVKKHKGKVKKSDHWGKKLLAYPIKKNLEGYYGHWVAELPGEAVAKMTEALRVDETVLRYLLVVQDKETEAKKPKKKTKSK